MPFPPTIQFPLPWPNLAALLPAPANLLSQAILFAACWFAVTFVMLLWSGYERTVHSAMVQAAYRRLILVLTVVAYFLLSGAPALSVAFGALAWGLTFIAARRLPDWNSRGQAHFAAFLAATLLLLIAVVQATVRLGPNPTGIAISAGILVFEVLITLLSVGFIYEALNVACRVRWRHLTPPITFHTGYTPKVSIHVPAHSEPVAMVQDTLRSLTRLDYPDYEIIMIDDNTAEPELWRPVLEFCEEQGIRVYHLEQYPGFKSGALNFALSQADPAAQIIAVVDADYQVLPDYLRQTVPYFQDPSVAFVQTPQAFREVDTPFLRRAELSQEYWFDVGMRSRNEHNAIIFCGTMGLIRRSALTRVGGWSEWCVTEDAEASFRMLSRGYTSAYVYKVFGRGLLPVTFDDLRKQRFRWAFGGVQIVRRYLGQFLPWRRATPQRPLRTVQRLDYLLGGLGWFADLVILIFSLLLLAGALGVALGLDVPIRALVAPALLLPLLFVYTGVLRTAWALRVTSGSSWGEAVGAFWIWMGLSLTVARACISGLLHKEGVFLRTPKTSEDPTPLEALRPLGWELTLGGALMGTIPLLLARLGSLDAVLSAGLLAWHSSIYLSAPWNALSAYRGPDLRWRLAGALGILFVLAPYAVWLALSWPLVLAAMRG